MLQLCYPERFFVLLLNSTIRQVHGISPWSASSISRRFSLTHGVGAAADDVGIIESCKTVQCPLL
jgi:hypothetical protein